jgi:hypothetical protein
MYFDGSAARWLQSVENKARHVSWENFCKLVHDRFGRDQHENLIRQLFHIKQTGSVADYVEEYAQLVDQLAAYTSTTDPLYYTLRFIDGLREDIKSIVLVQRPPDLDTACVLAALQEEVGDSSRRRDFKRSDSSYMSKSTSKNPLPLPAPPARDKQGNSLLAEDRRGADSTRTASSLETKAATLRSYRRAMGLCYKCNERWSREHKCAPTVQLHAVQELWELFQLEDEGTVRTAVFSIVTLSLKMLSGQSLVTPFSQSYEFFRWLLMMSLLAWIGWSNTAQ